MGRAMRLTLLLLACALLAVPVVAADPPFSDCDQGVVVGGQFTGWCGQAPDCMAIVVMDRHQGTIGCQ